MICPTQEPERDPEALMTRKEVADFLQCSVRQLDNLDETFPKPINISTASPRWRRRTLIAWFDLLETKNTPSPSNN